MSGHSNHVCELELMGRRAYARGISYKSFYSLYGSILDRLQTDGSDIPEHLLPLSAQFEAWKYFWPNEASLPNIPTWNPREPQIDPGAQNQITTLLEDPPSSPRRTLAEDAPTYSDDIGEIPGPREAHTFSATAACSPHLFASSPTSGSVNRAHLLSIEQDVSQEKVITAVPIKSLSTERSLQKPIVRLPPTFQPPVRPLHNTATSADRLITETTPRLDSIDDDANDNTKYEPYGVADGNEFPFQYKPLVNNQDHIDIVARQELWRHCANCHANDHLLQFCMGPVDKFGFISGCPRCNTMTHLFEHCPSHTENDLKSYLKYLVTSRHNRPPIRWTQDFRGIPNFWNQSMRPWTFEFSLKQASKHGDSYISSGQPGRNIDDDPAWRNPDTIPVQAYPEQRVQDMRQRVEPKHKKLLDKAYLNRVRTLGNLNRLRRSPRLLGQDSTLPVQKFEEVLYLSGQISSQMRVDRDIILRQAKTVDYILALERKEASGNCLLLTEAEAMKTKEARLIDLTARIDRYLEELHAFYDNKMGLRERITRLLNQVQSLVNFESMQNNGATLNNNILEKIATLREKEKILKVLFGAYRRRFSVPPEPCFILLNRKTASCTDFRDFAYPPFYALHYMPPPETQPQKSRNDHKTLSSPTMDPNDTANQNNGVPDRHSANEEMYRAYEKNYGSCRSPHDWQDSLSSAKDLSSVWLDKAPSSSDSKRSIELAGSVQYKVALSKEQKASEKEISGLQREIKEIEGFEKRTETLTTKQLELVAKKEEKKERLASLRGHQQSNGPESQTVQMMHKLEKSRSSRFTQAEKKKEPVNSPRSGAGRSSISTSSSTDSLLPLPSQVNSVPTKVFESKPRVSANSYAGRAAHVPPNLEPPREDYRKNEEVSTKQEEWPSMSSQARMSSPTISKEAKTMSYAEKARQMPRKTPPNQQRCETNILPEAQDESPAWSSGTSSEEKELDSDVTKKIPTLPHAKKSGEVPYKPGNSPAQQVHEYPKISNLQDWPAMSSQTEVLASNVNNLAPGTSYAKVVAQEPPDLEARLSYSGPSSEQEEWPATSSEMEVLSSDVIDRNLEISYAEMAAQEPPNSEALEERHDDCDLYSAQEEWLATSSETEVISSDIIDRTPEISYAEMVAQEPPSSEAPGEHHDDSDLSSVQEERLATSSETEVLCSDIMDQASEIITQKPSNSEPFEKLQGDYDSFSAPKEWPTESSDTEILSFDIIDRAPEISSAEKIVQEAISPKLESSKESSVLERLAPFPILSAMESQAAERNKLKISEKLIVARSQDPFPIKVAMETQSVASDDSESTYYSDIASGRKKTRKDTKRKLKVLKSKLPPPVYRIHGDSSSLNELQSFTVAENELTSTSNPASKVADSGEDFQEITALPSLEQESTSSTYVPPHRRRISSFCGMKSSSSLQSGNTNIYIPPPRRRISSSSDVEFILPSNSISLNQKKRLSSESMGHFFYEPNTHNSPSTGSPKSRQNQPNSHAPSLRVLIERAQEDAESSMSHDSQGINSKQQIPPLHSPAPNNNQLLFPPTGDFPESATKRSSSVSPSPDAEDVDLRSNISRASSPGSTNLQHKQTRTLRRPKKRRALSSDASVSIQTSSSLVPVIAVAQTCIGRNYNGSSKDSLGTDSSVVDNLSDTDFPSKLPLPDDFDVLRELEHLDQFDISLHHPHPDDFLLSDDEDDVEEGTVLNPPDSFEFDVWSECSFNQDAMDANAGANANTHTNVYADADADTTPSNPNPNIQKTQDSQAEEHKTIICWQCNKVGHLTTSCPERAFNPLIQETSHRKTTTKKIQESSIMHQETSLNISTSAILDESIPTKKEKKEEDIERKHPSPTHPPGAMRDNGSIVQFERGDWKCGLDHCDYWNFAGNTCCLWCGATTETAAVVLGERVARAGAGAGAAHGAV